MSPLPLLSPDPPLRHPLSVTLPALRRPRFGHLGTGLFCPIFGHSGTGLSATSSPFTPHLPHLPQFPPSPTQPLRLPPLRGTPYHFFGFLCSFSTVLVAMLFSRAACCALSHTHIASRKVVLAAHFFSLVLMLQDARLLFCSTPPHITPHPSPGSNPTANYTSLIISFSTILDVYMFAPPPPPIASSSSHAARRHLSSNHTDFGKSPSLAFYSLPWIGALLSFYFVSRHFIFNLFACFNAFAGARLILPSSPRRCSVRRASPAAPYCAFCGLICPHASPEHRRMRHIQCRNTFLIVLWHI